MKFNPGEFVISTKNTGPVYSVLENLPNGEVRVVVVIGVFKIDSVFIKNRPPSIYTAKEEILVKIDLKELTERLVDYVLED